MENEKYMALALKEAMEAFKEDEVPIGCVIVKEEKIIASTHNRKVHDQKATSHAELLAINEASEYLKSWYLDECEMYVTLEPCIMCAGAIINARIKKVYIATDDPKGGAFGSSIDILKAERINHHPEIVFGMGKAEASKLLQTFFKAKRTK